MDHSFSTPASLKRPHTAQQQQQDEFAVPRVLPRKASTQGGARTHMHTHVCTRTNFKKMCIHTHSQTHTYIHITYKHTVHTHTHTYTRAHTHTHAVASCLAHSSFPHLDRASSTFSGRPAGAARKVNNASTSPQQQQISMACLSGSSISHQWSGTMHLHLEDFSSSEMCQATIQLPHRWGWGWGWGAHACLCVGSACAQTHAVVKCNVFVCVNG